MHFNFQIWHLVSIAVKKYFFKSKLECLFLHKMSRLDEEHESAVWMIYYLFIFIFNQMLQLYQFFLYTFYSYFSDSINKPVPGETFSTLALSSFGITFTPIVADTPFSTVWSKTSFWTLLCANFPLWVKKRQMCEENGSQSNKFLLSGRIVFAFQNLRIKDNDKWQTICMSLTD